MFEKSLGLRGPPALATAATIFMGQVEGPIFIRSYLPHLSRSELFCLMAVGLRLRLGLDHGRLRHHAAGQPAQRRRPRAGRLDHLGPGRGGAGPDPRCRRPRPRPPSLSISATSGATDSSIDAVIRGAGDGLSVVLNVAAALIVFVALVAMTDRSSACCRWSAARRISLQRGLAIVFTPLAWAIGSAGLGGAQGRLPAWAPNSC